MKDTIKIIQQAASSGELVLGFKKTKQTLFTGDPQLIVVSKNCPKTQKDKIAYWSHLSDTDFIEVDETSKTLGAQTEKLHNVSTLAVLRHSKK
ncbi:MAG: hypothetical protein GF334_03860 [Candidatus Altiarchaeales archaeon]|nr:hypothetical protein [Candidatus Altiarchaeales archaeon]